MYNLVTITKQRSRVVVLMAGLTIGATACGAASSAEGDDDPVDASDRTQVSPSAESFSPTETDRPLDLEGGVSSGTVDASSIVEGPPSGLGSDVAQATSEWPTDWSRRTVALEEFLLGIPTIDPRDRIPPIDTPRFEPIATASWLGGREPGALVQFNDEVRFYPLSILTRHEVVNDRYGDLPVVVTFCPLCNTAVAFDARVDGTALRFGVSGLLRKSDLVMWDEGTTTLWQQITGEAVVGALAGTRLDVIPTSIVSYEDAAEAFPDALSLSRETGYGTIYGANPYPSYSSSESPFLFSDEPDPRFPALSRVVGVNLEDNDKAYPFSVISEERVVNDEVGDVPIAVFWGGDTADALDAGNIADGQAIGTGIAFSRQIGAEVLTFSSVGGDRFTDAETGTTWSLLGQAVEGPLRGEQLETVPHRNEFWFAWAGFFPEAPVYSGR